MSFWDRFKRVSSTQPWGAGLSTVDPNRITPHEVGLVRKRFDTSDAIDVLTQCCLSYCGYVRQAALIELQKLDSPEAMPYVLDRLSDWVPEVRDEAWRTLKSLLDRGYADQLVKHHAIISSLKSKQRVDLSPQIDALNEHMLHPDAVQSIKDGVSDPWVTKRRFCLNLLIRDPDWHPFVVETAIRDRDQSIRRWLARQIVQGELHASDEIKRELMFDRSAIVSTTMLRSLDIEAARAIEKDIIHLTTHPSAPVRASAQFWAGKLEVANLLEHVRACFDSQEVDELDLGVVGALGELGGTLEDLARVRPLMTHPRTAFREYAIQAVARLTKDGQELDSLIMAMGDTSGRVRWLATQAILSRPRVLWFDRVSREFLFGSNLRSNAHIAELFSARVDWDVVPVILRALLCETSELERHAYVMLNALYHKYGTIGWARPSAKVWGEIVQLWNQVSHRATPKEAWWAWEHVRGTVELGLKEGWGESG